MIKLVVIDWLLLGCVCFVFPFASFVFSSPEHEIDQGELLWLPSALRKTMCCGQFLKPNNNWSTCNLPSKCCNLKHCWKRRKSPNNYSIIDMFCPIWISVVVILLLAVNVYIWHTIEHSHLHVCMAVCTSITFSITTHLKRRTTLYLDNFENIGTKSANKISIDKYK